MIVISALSAIAACAFAYRAHAQRNRSADGDGRTLGTSLDAIKAAETIQVLNDLKTELNVTFGFLQGHPRLCLGPCGALADEFRKSWNSRFSSPAQIVFVKILDDGYCRHVLIRLPNGWFFDGGRGVLSQEELVQLYQEVNGGRDSTMHLEVMDLFDAAVFRKNTVEGPYPDCPDFSREKAKQIIDRHLDQLRQRLANAG